MSHANILGSVPGEEEGCSVSVRDGVDGVRLCCCVCISTTLVSEAGVTTRLRYSIC